MNVSVLASAPTFIRTRARCLRFDDDTGGFTDGSDRSTGLRRDPHAARQGQDQRLAARDQAGRPRGRPDARDARAATRSSTPRASTTSCSAASRRSATRAPTSPRPPRSRPACPTRSPACSSTASAPPASRPSTSPRRRSPPAGRTSSSPAASSRCRACRWAPTAAPGRWTRRPNYDTYFVPQGIGADLIATIEGFSREDVDAYAARSQERAANAQAGGPLRELGRPGQGPQRERRARPRRVHPPGHDGRDARRAEALVRRDGRDGRLRRRRAAEVPLGREDRPRPHAGQLLRHRRRRGARWRSATSRPATSSA